MTGVEAGWLETLLVRRLTERSVARILRADVDKVLGPGENYTSDILRVNLTVVLGSGDITKKSVVVKIKSEKARHFLDRYGIYNKEREMYASIIPQYERLMDERGDDGGCLWADYYGSTNTQIVFDDLKAQGFHLASRHEGLDVDHTLLALRSLGRFHAMSVAAIRSGRIDVKHLPKYFFSLNDHVSRKFCRGGLLKLIDAMSTTWDSKWESTAEKLKHAEKTMPEKLEELGNIDDSQFKVLNHGDCWVNNMLFKYEPISNRPSALRFVDFQFVHYNSYAWDLVYFLYSSVRPGVRREHMSRLLEAYRASLVTGLGMYGCSADNAPTAEDVASELQRMMTFALMVTTTLTPVMMADPEDAMEIAAIATEDPEHTVHNRGMYLNPRYAAVVQDDLEFFVGRGVL